MKANGPQPRLTKHGAALRKFALSLPDAHEDFPWGHVAVKVGKKAFVFIAAEDGATSLSAKLLHSNKTALAHPFAKPTEYGLGKHGWVTFTFARGAEPRMELLRQAILESYRAIAPNRAVKRLDAALQ